MSLLWNELDLPKPPVCTTKYTKRCNITGLSSTCKELINVFKLDDQLLSEYAYLTKLIYKCQNRLRRDHGFQNMKKVKRCLKRYQSIDRIATVEYFSKCLPETLIKSEMYIPTRQMLEYLLVRIMGLTKLLQQTRIYSENSANYINERIRLGHSWSLASMLLGIVSKIWSVCEEIILKLCKSYNALVKYQKQLPTTGAVWLPKDFILPTNLIKWCDIDTKRDSDINQKEKKDAIFRLISQQEDVEGEEEEIVQMDTTIDLPERIIKKAIKRDVVDLNDNEEEEEDIGEFVEKSSQAGNSSSVHSSSSDEEKPKTAKKVKDCKRKNRIAEINKIEEFDELFTYISKNLNKPHLRSPEKRKRLKVAVRNLRKYLKVHNAERINRYWQITKSILCEK